VVRRPIASFDPVADEVEEDASFAALHAQTDKPSAACTSRRAVKTAAKVRPYQRTSHDLADRRLVQELRLGGELLGWDYHLDEPRALPKQVGQCDEVGASQFYNDIAFSARRI